MKGCEQMPNRILKESICRSDEVDSLSWFEEVLFYRLIVTCDDFGRYDGRPKIIKGTCFPLKDITEKDIDKALGKLADVGLIKVYESQGRPYLQLVTWADHQRIRNQKSKYPEIGEDSKLLMPKCSNDTLEPKKTEVKVKPPEPQMPAIITLQLNTGEEWEVTQADIDEWSSLYPAVDIIQCLRNMKGWIGANPNKRKTARGIRKFVTTWLQKEQDRGGTPGYVRPSYSGGSKVEQFAAGAREWANNG